MCPWFESLLRFYLPRPDGGKISKSKVLNWKNFYIKKKDFFLRGLLQCTMARHYDSLTKTEGQKLEQNSKSTQTPYFPSDSVKKQDIGCTGVLHVRRKRKEKTGQILSKDNLKIKKIYIHFY